MSITVYSQKLNGNISVNVNDYSQKMGYMMRGASWTQSSSESWEDTFMWSELATDSTTCDDDCDDE